VGVEGRFSARLDPDRRPYVRVGWTDDAGIAHQERLPIGIGRVDRHACRVRRETGVAESGGQDGRQLCAEVAVDIALAGVLDGIPASASFLAAQGLELVERDRLTEVSAEDRDVDVFPVFFLCGEPFRMRMSSRPLRF
jgi:hypothetical protein